MIRPNIFEFATSELSQDALLAYLIQWGDNKFKAEDRDLNDCAKSFIIKLLNLDSSYKIDSVKVGRQWNNIDVWALVNNKHFIVIEDKVSTKEHSNQLIKYSSIAKKHYENTDIEVKLIYYKMEEQGQLKNVHEAGYSIFQRVDMISILNKYTSKNIPKHNDIILDYYRNLISIDNKINSFQKLPFTKWHKYSWQGFYSELQKELGGSWDYIPNASGGFIGFWWNYKFSKTNEYEYYLLLQEGKLVIKLYVYNETKRREIRHFIRSVLFTQAKKQNIELIKFGRLGANMGVAALTCDYRILNSEKVIDLPLTVNKLKEIESLLNQTEHAINNSCSLS